MNKLGVALIVCTFFNTGIEASPQAVVSETGNWYEKLQWWHKAKPMSDNITELVDVVDNMSKELVENAQKAFPRVAELYESLGVSPDDMHKKITEYESKLNAQREEAENAFDDDVLAHAKKNETVLRQLKQNMELLEQMRLRIQSVLRQIREIEQRVEGYDEGALRTYKKISGEAGDDQEEIFNDQEAHQLYRQLENYFENVRSLALHVDGPLRMYVGNILTRMTSVSASILATIDLLEEQEIYIKPRPESVEPQELIEKEEVKKDQPKEGPVRHGYWQRFKDYVSSFF